MPYRVNGCGTGYYGKKNRDVYTATCKSCGYYGYLETYETTTYFSMFLIPLIPLYKCKVIDYCPNCSRHYVIKDKQWQKYKNETIIEATRKIQSQSANSDYAKDFLSLVLNFRDKENFLMMADSLQRAFIKDIDIQKIIAYIYMSFKMNDEAEKVLKSALLINSEDELAKEYLAEIYILKLEPDRAEPYLNHIFSKNQFNKLSYLLRLAGSYQAAGNHSKALYLLDHLKMVYPSIEKDKTYKQLRKVSEKLNITNEKKIPSWLQKDINAAPHTYSQSTLSEKFTKLIGPVIFLAVIILFLFGAYNRGNNRKVYVVNGLSKPYSVKINSKEIQLPPLRPILAKVKEGEILIEPDNTYTGIKKSTVRIETPFLTRLFSDEVFIINPDKTVIIQKEKTYYIPDNEKEPANLDNEFKLSGNKILHRYRGIDYIFEDFPERVTLRSKKAEARTKISIYGGNKKNNLAIMYYHFLHTVSKTEAVDYIKNYLEIDPENSIIISYLAIFMSDEEFLKYAKDYLEKKPVNIAWHKQYQDKIEKKGELDKLYSDYKEQLNKDPQNKSLMYLLSRVSPDEDEQNRLLEAATAEPEPNPEAIVSIGLRYLSSFNFIKSMEFLRKANELLPDRADLTRYYIQSLIANEEWQKCIDYYEKKITPSDSDDLLISPKFYCIYKLKGLDEAVKAINDFIRRSKSINNAAYIKFYTEPLIADLKYETGDFKAGIDFYLNEESYSALMIDAIEKGLLKEAEGYLNEDSADNNDNFSSYVYMYIGAEKNGNKEMSEKYLNLLIEALPKKGVMYKKFADLLKSGNDSEFKKYLAIPLYYPDKRIILAALAFRFPEHKKEYLDASLNLWFIKTYPYHFFHALAEK